MVERRAVAVHYVYCSLPIGPCCCCCPSFCAWMDTTKTRLFECVCIHRLGGRSVGWEYKQIDYQVELYRIHWNKTVHRFRQATTTLHSLTHWNIEQIELEQKNGFNCFMQTSTRTSVIVVPCLLCSACCHELMIHLAGTHLLGPVTDRQRGTLVCCVAKQHCKGFRQWKMKVWFLLEQFVCRLGRIDWFHGLFVCVCVFAYRQWMLVVVNHPASVLVVSSDSILPVRFRAMFAVNQYDLLFGQGSHFDDCYMPDAVKHTLCYRASKHANIYWQRYDSLQQWTSSSTSMGPGHAASKIRIDPWRSGRRTGRPFPLDPPVFPLWTLWKRCSSWWFHQSSRTSLCCSPAWWRHVGNCSRSLWLDGNHGTWSACLLVAGSGDRAGVRGGRLES